MVMLLVMFTGRLTALQKNVKLAQWSSADSSTDTIVGQWPNPTSDYDTLHKIGTSF